MATKKPITIENKESKLNSVNYMRWDRVFMAYGSTMNSLQHILTKENWVEMATNAWELSRTLVDGLVEDLYSDNEIPIIQTEEKPL